MMANRRCVLLSENKGTFDVLMRMYIPIIDHWLQTPVTWHSYYDRDDYYHLHETLLLHAFYNRFI